MAYSIELVGLINVYHQGEGQKLLLLPDGRQPELNIPPHIASIVVLESQLLGNDDWEWEDDPRLDELHVRSFLIDPPSMIAISGLTGNGGELDTTAWDGVIPILSTIDRKMHILPERAETIAQIPVANGKLEAFYFADDSVVGRLTVPNTGLVTIKANAKNGHPKTLTLLDGASIVIANLSRKDSALPRPEERGDSHFRLYGQLDVQRRSVGLTREPQRDDRLQHLPSGHPYLAFIRANEGAFPSPGCSATGGP